MPSSFKPPENISRTEYVMTEIKDRLATRKLGPGSKLPSIRNFATTMKVSKSTVVEAYERLAAEGIISSQRGSGFYVTGHIPPLSLTDMGPKLDRAVDPFWVSRQSLETNETFLKPGCGWLPTSWMPEDSIGAAMRSLARKGSNSLTEYGTPLGFAPLRHHLSRRIDAQNIDVSPDQIILTDSGTQAIDLLCRFFLEPGDTVLVDDPCYFNFNALLRVHRAKIVAVPYTPAGPDVEQFKAILKDHKPRLYITNSGFHNPTGASISPITAHKLLILAEQFNLTIIEDDIFGDFETTPAPRLASFDGLERVIYIGSFSKTISASVRCGYIAARPDWIDGLVDLKIATSFGGNVFNAELIWHVLKNGSYRRHIQDLRERLAKARIDVQSKLESLGITPWITPKGGMYLWCRLPDGIDSAQLAQSALPQNIVLAPGNVFSVSGTASQFMRFNVAQSLQPNLYATLALELENLWSKKEGG
ncbi:PLP-dependent aminotransferase family protein [Amylibacter sp. SFDW26]|uniref:aminotransferase-like domain-containing protein n=1 Tax=Amylibacter sp. SFDW26 TaxID=2652722 RepID=UPI0012629178|nr:PLP-dependent aminotransferase family protein [Amylibacter sp. SFDW26]KAB7616328.1 PLP-dependent aminotransferase family protein [Amylibacter sp. SFDW26]